MVFTWVDEVDLYFLVDLVDLVDLGTTFKLCAIYWSEPVEKLRAGVRSYVDELGAV